MMGVAWAGHDALSKLMVEEEELWSRSIIGPFGMLWMKGKRK